VCPEVEYAACGEQKTACPANVKGKSEGECLGVELSGVKCVCVR
jgi:hypothetical protein